MKFGKFKENTEALSPVVATVILIAVAVAVSVGAAGWMGGMSIGFMGNAEQASIKNVVLTNTVPGGSVVCSVLNTGSASVTIISGTVDGAVWTLAAPVTIAKGSTSAVTITAAAGTPFSTGAQYSINLMTAKGNALVYTATK
jgi:flagellin-like protein